MADRALTHQSAREPRRVVDTVLGPLKMIPECQAQAVCVNGLKCWEAGCCLKGRRDV